MLLYGVGILNIQPGQNVLEVGTGTAWLSHIMADITGNTGQVDSMDLDPALVALAKRKAKAFGVSNINFIAGNVYIEGQKLADESYDRILLSVVTSDLDLIMLMARKLKIGGQMVVFTKDEQDKDKIAVDLIYKMPNGELTKIPGLSF
jgi:protein-L-isoaspartate(D-aspartate) O-methyltransferase